MAKSFEEREARNKGENFFTDVGSAIREGSAFTRLSFLIWGAGYARLGQYLKGVVVTVVEALLILATVLIGRASLPKFGTLGTVNMEMVFGFATMKNVVNDYDNSFSILLLGVVTIVLIAALILLALFNLKSAHALQKDAAAGRHINTFREDVRSYINEKFHVTLLALPTLGVLVFTVVPLIIMIAVAFTNYDQTHMPPSELFTWVGLDNFKSLFSNSLSITFGYSFGKVLSWTLIWAFFATFTTYFGGILLAKFLNNKMTKFPKFWRSLFVVTIAVPQFVTLLLVRNFFSDTGIMNTMMANAGVTDFLKNIGLVQSGLSYIPFLTNPRWAKVMIILINIWVGVPYQMLIATGVLMNIPSEMTEAADIDGANSWQRFWHIIMPYMLAVTGPNLVTDFVKNINNFNVIYLLTQDVFFTNDQMLANSNAKEVDLLVTWLFRLTQEYYNYKMAAVIGIFVFIICAVFTIVCFSFLNRGNKEATFQ